MGGNGSCGASSVGKILRRKSGEPPGARVTIDSRACGGAPITGGNPCFRCANHSRQSDWVVRPLARQATVASATGIRRDASCSKKKFLEGRDYDEECTASLERRGRVRRCGPFPERRAPARPTGGSKPEAIHSNPHLRVNRWSPIGVDKGLQTVDRTAERRTRRSRANLPWKSGLQTRNSRRCFFLAEPNPILVIGLLRKSTAAE